MSVLSERLAAPHRERVVKNPFPWYAPRFWHGMRFSTWVRALAANGFRVSPSKLPTALSISAFSGFNSAAAAAERLVYGRKITATELAAPPIFILGHWRAGTTFLHELLIRDPEHTYATTYQCFAPHHFVLTDKWLTSWSSFLLPSRRPMDNMAAGWQRPQEDEFALGNLGVPTPYTSMMFPELGPKSSEYLDLQELPPAELNRWKQELARFFQRITFRDNRRIVVKSPPHTARVRTLLEMFPEAKFVHLVRDPYELFQSTVKLWKSLNEVQRLNQLGEQDWVEEYVLDSHERMYAAFEQDSQLLDEGQLVELRYEELIDQPLEQLREVYQSLDLGEFRRVEDPVTQYLAEVRNYRRNKHELAEQQREQVRLRWAKYFERYGYL